MHPAVVHPPAILAGPNARTRPTGPSTRSRFPRAHFLLSLKSGHKVQHPPASPYCLCPPDRFNSCGLKPDDVAPHAVAVTCDASAQLPTSLASPTSHHPPAGNHPEVSLSSGTFLVLHAQTHSLTQPNPTPNASHTPSSCPLPSPCPRPHRGDTAQLNVLSLRLQRHRLRRPKAVCNNA